MRERPRLAREVADVRHAHADFLVHFAREALLERLARLDEAGERAVHARRKVRAAAEQELVLSPISPMNKRHHRRSESRIGGQLALRAHPGALFSLELGLRTAAAAKLVRAIPGDELQCAASEREMGVVEHGIERTQSRPGETGRRWAALGQLVRPALHTAQT